MTAQEIFDQVVRHLLTQRHRATANGDLEGLCCYRTFGGMRCAVGCLIPDDVYSPTMEQKSIGMLWRGWPELAWMQEHDELLSELQCLHDNEEPEDWEVELLQVALDHGLNMPLVPPPPSPKGWEEVG